MQRSGAEINHFSVSPNNMRRKTLRVFSAYGWDQAHIAALQTAVNVLLTLAQGSFGNPSHDLAVCGREISCARFQIIPSAPVPKCAKGTARQRTNQPR